MERNDMHKKNGRKRWVNLILVVSTLVLLPGLAIAGTKVGEVIGNVCDWLSGEVASGISALVVIYSGYEMLHGDIDKMKFGVRAVAIGLIVGGSYITRSIILN
tara:strand:- start:200 stop:508 length:309 start_codon:yes stop_codon:yes gene_type:complete